MKLSGMSKFLSSIANEGAVLSCPHLFVIASGLPRRSDKILRAWGTVGRENLARRGKVISLEWKLFMTFSVKKIEVN